MCFDINKRKHLKRPPDVFDKIRILILWTIINTNLEILIDFCKESMLNGLH